MVRAGLRTRLTAVVAVTGVVTLVVAAVALIAPLDRRLRHDALLSITHDMRTLTPSLRRSFPDRDDTRALEQLGRSLKRRTGAEIQIVDRSGTVLAATDADERQPYAETLAAIASGRVKRTATIGADGRLEAHVALPVRTDHGTFAVLGVQSLKQAQAAGTAVRRALLLAGIIGLGVGLPLGLVMATRLVRRIGALRRTTMRVAELGPTVDMEPDRTRDEIGDLSRAFATMQERLRQQEQARKTFVATASHELRTPLASLRLMLEELRHDLESGTPDLEGARDEARRADRQSARLASLAEDLLRLSRIDAGTSIRTEPVDLGEVVRSVLAEFETRAQEQDVALALESQPAVWASGDPGSVAQIVRILVDNGLRFSPPARELSIAISAQNGRALVAVSDAGPGVPDTDRERIFERFTRGAETGDHAGFGLGLAVGRELAERLGGTLSLDSATTGARFVLELEAAPEP
jgi:signal transduction histidine kinase